MKQTLLITSICAIGLLFNGNSNANHQRNKSHAAQSADFTFYKKDAVTIDRTSSFELDIRPEKALPLFTAPGEILWAPGWKPNILTGDGFEQGTVWLTKHGDTTTYWHVSTYDKISKEAVYTRVTPGSDMGTVTVVLSPNGKGGSKVSVTYKLTSVSFDGNKKLTKHFDEASYTTMIKHWRKLIIDNMDKINSHY